MFNKLQLYYQPANRTEILSLSISISELNEKENTYKHKVTFERVDGKYKKKEIRTGLDEMLSSLEPHINASNFTKHEIDMEKDYFYFKCNWEYATNDKQDIEGLLQALDFYNIINHDMTTYKKCD